MVSKEKRRRLFYRCHKGNLGRHRNVEETCYQLMLKYYWPKMISDVEMYMEQCDVCGKICNRDFGQLRDKARTGNRRVMVGKAYDCQRKQTLDRNRTETVAIDRLDLEK